MAITKKTYTGKDNKLYCRYVVDYYNHKGERKRKRFKVKSQADSFLAKIIHSKEKGFATEADKTLTFTDGANYFMQNYTKVYCKPSVQDTYKHYLNKHLIPYFGKTKIINIKRSMITQFILYLQENTKLKNKSINKLLALLILIFNKLVEAEFLLKNPAQGIKKLKEEKAEMRALDVKEVHLLLNTCLQYSKDFYPILYTALNTGMRRGELLALKWSKINFKDKTITINENLYQNIFVPPKTKSSNRIINITDDLIKILKEWKLKSKPNKYDLVFPNSIGEPMDGRNMVRREFDTLIKLINLGHVCWHDLRHTYASILIAKGVNIKFIQAQLGHSSIKITLDTYGHLMKETCDTAMNVLSEVMKSEESDMRYNVV